METNSSTGGLKERLKSWRSELTGIGLAKDDRDELQSHMEDILAELLAKGLNEDEAWTAALNRIGEASDIKREYQKVQEGRIPWFNQVLFWLILFFLGLQLLAIGPDIIFHFIKIGQILSFSLFCFTVLCLIIWGIVSNRQGVRGNTRLGICIIAVPSILISLFFGFLTHFDGPQCYNSNQVFKNKLPKSEVYVSELVKHFTQNGTSNLYYRFAYYYTEKDRDYIVMKAIGKGFCGFFSLDITNSEKMKHLIRVKGMSYSGSMWRGLKFDLVADKSRTKFIFRSVESIVD